MRLVIVAVALACFGLSVRADEPAKYYLVDGKVIEKRISDLEARVEKLEAEKAALTAQVQKASPAAVCPCGANCPCSSAPAAATAPAPVVTYTQVCGPNGCRLVANPAPGGPIVNPNWQPVVTAGDYSAAYPQSFQSSGGCASCGTSSAPGGGSCGSAPGGASRGRFHVLGWPKFR